MSLPVRHGVLTLLMIAVAIAISFAVVTEQALAPDSACSVACDSHHVPLKGQPVHSVRLSHSSPRTTRSECAAAALTELPHLLHTRRLEALEEFAGESSSAVRRLSLLSALRI